jgi:DNA-directed RNA polymerase subunit RPC12/RpoP
MNENNCLLQLTKRSMDKTPVQDPSMTPSATTAANVIQPKAMIYVCAKCHKDNELKSTDVIRCTECDRCRILYKKRTKRLIAYDAR